MIHLTIKLSMLSLQLKREKKKKKKKKSSRKKIQKHFQFEFRRKNEARFEDPSDRSGTAETAWIVCFVFSAKNDYACCCHRVMTAIVTSSTDNATGFLSFLFVARVLPRDYRA